MRVTGGAAMREAPKLYRSLPLLLLLALLLLPHWRLRRCLCRSRDALDVVRREKLGNRCGPREDLHEAICVRLIALQRREELLRLRWRVLERRQLACELVDRQRRLVTLPLELRQSDRTGHAECVMPPRRCSGERRLGDTWS